MQEHQQDKEKKQLNALLNQSIQLSRRMIILAGEQHIALKERNIDKFEQVTKEYTYLTRDFNDLNNQLKSVWEEISYSENKELAEMKDELSSLFKELKEINRRNLDLIKASSEVMRSVLHMLIGQSSTVYGELGEVTDNSRKPLVLDRMV